MDSMCTAKCTIQSLCLEKSNPFQTAGVRSNPFDGLCCNGGKEFESCAVLGADTCAIDSSCLLHPPNSINANLQCVTQLKTSTLWIGVILTLLGAATINIGLNVQKLAHRKRIEKRENRDANQGDVTILDIVRRMSNIDISPSPTMADPDTPTLTRGGECLSANTTVYQYETRNETNLHAFNRRRSIAIDIDIDNLNHQQDKTQKTPEIDYSMRLNFGQLAKDPIWLLGFFVFILGNVFNIVALQFAPQSLVAPLGSFSLVVNVIVAPILNFEKWGYKDIIGVMFIVAGSIIVVAFAGSTNHNYCLSVLLYLFGKLATVIFLTVIGVLLSTVYLFIVIVEKNLVDQDHGDIRDMKTLSDDMNNPDQVVVKISQSVNNGGVRKQRMSIISDTRRFSQDIPKSFSSSEMLDEISAQSRRSESEPRRIKVFYTIEEPVIEKDTDNQSVKVVKIQDANLSFYSRMKSKISKNPTYVLISNFKLIPRLKERIPLSSVYVRMLLPFSYASLGGLMATLTVLFAKATVNLFTVSIFEGDNQFTEPLAWLIATITIVTAVSQIYWINMGLARYDALLQIPVFYVVWTLFDVIGGGVYYGEFDGFSALKYFFFILGVVIIFGGVVVLAGRLKNIQDEDTVLEKKATTIS